MSTLTKDEIATLELLLKKLKSEPEPAKPKKRGRPPKAKPIPSPAHEEIDEDLTPYEQPELEEIPLASLQKPKIRKKKSQIESAEAKIGKHTGRGTKQPARRMQLTIPKGGRPNLFETSPDFNAFKHESGIGPPPRQIIRNQPVRTRVEVECIGCGDICSVHPAEVGSEGRYRCQNCIGGGDSYETDEEEVEDDN